VSHQDTALLHQVVARRRERAPEPPSARKGERLFAGDRRRRDDRVLHATVIGGLVTVELAWLAVLVAFVVWWRA
jgi:hypothetical protein